MLTRLFMGFVLLLPLLAQAEVRVFACEPEWAALAGEIGGDKVSAFAATTAAQDPHRIQARPSLIAKARNADLLVCTGAGLEIGWLPPVLQQSANPKIQPGGDGYLEVASLVPLQEVPAKLDRAMGDVHPAGNPHIQLDPRNYPPAAKRLAQMLAAADPADAAYFQERLGSFLERWQKSSAAWQARVADLKGKPVAVQHNFFVYLLNWAGLREAATLEPFPGALPTTASLDAALAKVKAAKAGAVLVANYEDPRPSQWLAERAGVAVVVLPSTVGGDERAGDLFGLFDDIVERLRILKR